MTKQQLEEIARLFTPETIGRISMQRMAIKKLCDGHFTNECIIEPRYGKPHIVKIAGLWRVSKWKRHNPTHQDDRYFKAHELARRLNAIIQWGPGK